MKFNNIPKKEVEERVKKPEPEVVVAKKKSKRRWISWKIKAVALMIIALFFTHGVLTVINGISQWYDVNRIEFYNLIEIDVKVNPLFTIEPRFISPEASTSAVENKESALVPEVKAAEVAASNGVLRGTASYYSESGCLGCNAGLIMANGEKLNDKEYTLALTPAMVKEYKLLNDMVKVTNLKNKSTVIARVTDTGGFAKYNRVADLSVATRDALGCQDLCEVEITF